MSIEIFTKNSMNSSHLRWLRGSIIAIEGNIGIGKSTFGEALEKYLIKQGFNAVFYPEYKNIELLEQYIGDMKKYAYTFQMIMLSKRIDIYNKALNLVKTGGIAILDRSLYGDYAFALKQHRNGNFTEEEWAIYNSMVKQEICLEPNYIIYIEGSLELIKERIKLRGIKSEIEGYSDEYLNELDTLYQEVIPGTAIIINASKIIMENGQIKEETLDWVLIDVLDEENH